MAIIPALAQVLILLLQNAALLVLGVLGYAWLHTRIVGWSAGRRAVLEGAVCAALALLCMAAPLIVTPGIQVDARATMVALATLFGGPLAGVIAGSAAIAYRVFLGGAGMPAAVVAIVATYAAICLSVRVLDRRGIALGYRHLAVLGGVVALCAALGSVVYAIEGALGLIGADFAWSLVGNTAWEFAAISSVSFVVLATFVIYVDRNRSMERSIVESEGPVPVDHRQLARRALHQGPREPVHPGEQGVRAEQRIARHRSEGTKRPAGVGQDRRSTRP